MKHYRYGKFKISNHYRDCTVLAFYTVVTVMSVVFYRNVLGIKDAFSVLTLLIIPPVLLMSIMVFYRIRKYRECFWIDGNVITLKSDGEVVSKTIPLCGTLVISNTVMLEGRDSISLKDRYMLLIIESDLDHVLTCIHNKLSIYTNLGIEHVLPWHTFYSCVCNQELLDYLTAIGRYTIVVPESLKDKFIVDFQRADLYIDRGY